jgi:ABC-type multidrug transport system fused ATPase/permease subunit
MIIALYASWRLTLTIFILIPIGAFAFFKVFEMIKAAALKDNTAYKKSVNFITDATQNIKTVLSLGHEK